MFPSASGRELFYRNGAAVMAVPIETDPSFAAGNPEVVFEDQYAGGPGGRTYDVSPNGERFLMIKERAVTDDASTRAQIHVVLNWLDELQRLVPTN